MSERVFKQRDMETVVITNEGKLAEPDDLGPFIYMPRWLYKDMQREQEEP